MSVAIPLQRSTRRVWLGAAGVAAVGGITAWIVTHPRPEAPVHPRLVPSGWSEPLFNGRSLKGWSIRSGTWVLADDEESAKMLAGTSGVNARRLLRSDTQPPRPLSHFELSLAVRLHQASAVEIHFGMIATAGDNPPRPTIRLADQTAWLAHRAADRGPSQPVTKPVTLSSTAEDQPRIIRLRRDATHWFASVDGQPLGTIPLAGPAEISEFRLSVEDGPAWFSDIEVEELIDPKTRPTP